MTLHSCIKTWIYKNFFLENKDKRCPTFQVSRLSCTITENKFYETLDILLVADSALKKNLIFTLRITSVNVNRSAAFFEFIKAILNRKFLLFLCRLHNSHSIHAKTSEAYSELSQTSKTELLVKIVLKFAKGSILDFWLGLKYASGRRNFSSTYQGSRSVFKVTHCH